MDGTNGIIIIVVVIVVIRGGRGVSQSGTSERLSPDDVEACIIVYMSEIRLQLIGCLLSRRVVRFELRTDRRT